MAAKYPSPGDGKVPKIRVDDEIGFLPVQGTGKFPRLGGAKSAGQEICTKG